MTNRSTRSRTTFFGLVCLLVVALVWWTAACTGSDPEAGSANGSPTGPVNACDHPNPGCPCSQAGQKQACGKVELRLGSFVSCSMGTTVCDGTKWQECLGDTVVAKSTGGGFSGGGLKLAALGTSGSCATNPCDPFCNNFVDNPEGLDAAGLGATEAGLSIAPSAGACICNQPSTPATLYTNLPNAAKGNPASCSGNDAGTATDNCNHDYQCVGGTCVPYAVSGVNPTCTASADYTLGLGCYSGSSWQLQLCNRGYVASPGLGSLVIAIGSGTPSTGPGACTTGATGAAWPTAGDAGATAADKGKCVINLATTTIGAGQCINVDLATQCTQLDGSTPLSGITAANTWAVVNPSTAILAGASPVTECDTCNNYTALAATAIPPLLSNAAVCASSTCGTVCGGASDAGVEGGAGCHTYVTGTVYDPGANIPLPAVAVYEPKMPIATTLPTFSAGVSCDTCASLLPTSSNLVSSTASDLDGTFALEVDALSGIPVVFQTGRWRRAITIGVDTPALTACTTNNITVAADCVYPGKNCKTRLPQRASEGEGSNIPLMALVTGQREPFECSIAKFMGGSEEIGVGGTKRLQLYLDTGADGWTSAPRTGTGAAITAPLVTSGSAPVLQATNNLTSLQTTAKNGTAWKASLPVLGVQTITGLSGLSAAYAPNGTLTLSGGVAVNTGTFTIVAFVSATSVKIANATGVADATGGATRIWRAGTGVTLNASYNGGTIKLSGGAVGTNNTTWTIGTVTASASTASATINGPLTLPDTKSGTTAMTWKATQPGTLTVSGLAGIVAGDVGATLTLSGSTTAANDGTYQILTVVDATTVTVKQLTGGPAVTEGADIAWSLPGPVTPLPAVGTSLWDTQAHLNAYDQVILGCGGNSSAVATLGSTVTSKTNQGYFYNYMRAGGRSFGNHWSARGLMIPTTSAGYAASTGGWNATSTFLAGGIQSSPGSPLNGKVSPNGTPTAPHSNFQTWLTAQGAYTASGLNTPEPVAGEALNPSATQSFEWLRGSGDTFDTSAKDNWATVPGGNFSLIYSFDTNDAGIVPTLASDGGAGAGCGRTIVSDMHVDTGRSGSGTSAGNFPDECKLTAGLSANEKAFEYLFFVLSSCAIGGAPIVASAPSPPPAAPTLGAVTFTRDYHATCPAGTAVVWQSFSWQAAIPSGTNIVFQAQTAPDAAGSPGAFGSLVSVGTASTSTGGSYYTPATTVDQDLTGATPAQRSLDWLRVQMTFNPSGSTSPVLQSWVQTYDCVPAE